MLRSRLPIPLGLFAFTMATVSLGSAAAQAPLAAQAPSAVQPSAPQGNAAAPSTALSADPIDPASLLGSTLPQVIGAFGAPRAVHAVRGPEAWQDDVVFAYDGLEIYWFRDRVWQVRPLAAFGVKSGDSRDTVISALGEPLHRNEGSFVYQIPSRAWPQRLSVAFDADGRVADLFVYRADF